MKNIAFFFFFFIGIGSISAQDIQGYWVGMITEGHEQYKFEIDIYQASRRSVSVIKCHSCKKVKGHITDSRGTERITDFGGIINKDYSVNLADTKLYFNERDETKTLTKYQFVIEIKNGEPWLVGYYQDYNKKGRKLRQGRIYLKREPMMAKKV